MATYTVKSGDTLSGIAGRLGVSQSSLTGYRSGNPNLIYPGEVLSYGGGGGAPAAAPAAKPRADEGSLQRFADSQTAAMNALLERQKQEQQGLFNQYTQKIEGQEKLPDMYGRLQNELGIPELSAQAQVFKDQIYGTKNLIDRLDEDITSRTRGTYTTAGMKNRIEAYEGEKLNTTLSRLGTGLAPVADMLTSAQGQLQTLLPLSIQQQDRELKPLEMQINSLSDRFAREISGYNSNKETQLTALMDKLERDRYLDDRDWELAQQLAKEERDFSKQKQLAQMSLSAYAGLGGGGGGAAKSSTPAPTYSQWQGLSVGNGGSNLQISVPSSSLQGGSSGIKLQGTSPYLQGSSFSLQGGGGIRLQ